MKKIVSCLIIILSVHFLSWAQADQDSASYYHGKIRVKLKESVEPYAQALSQPSGITKAQRLTLPSAARALNTLNTRYRVVDMERVFPDAGIYEAKHRKYGLHLWYDITYTVDSNAVSLAKSYTSSPGIEIAEPIYKIQPVYQNTAPQMIAYAAGETPSDSTNDPMAKYQWHYHNTGSVSGSIKGVDINLRKAWGITMGDSSVIVAINDGGLDSSHNDLKANLWRDANGNIGYNFVRNNHNVTPYDHGVHVGGTVAAVNNNDLLVAGVAGGRGVVNGRGTGARLMSCQILALSGTQTVQTPNPEKAFIYSADNGAVISQNSWGYSVEGQASSLVRDAIDYFIGEAGTDENSNPLPNTKMKGGIVIFAAGNQGSAGVWYPQRYEEVIAVSSIGPNGQRAAYSNYGPWVDIAAPGGLEMPGAAKVFSTLPNENGGTYGGMFGTSMACPHVSGVAALVLAQYGHANYTPDSLRTRLLGTVRSLWTLDASYAPYMGYGLLDAYEALKPMVPVTALQIENSLGPQTSITDTIGSRKRLFVSTTPATATITQAIWSSSDATVASINKGYVTFLKAGTATVTAKSMSDTTIISTCNITVTPKLVAGISFSFTDTIAYVGKPALSIVANITPSSASNQNVTWTLSNPQVASVTPNELTPTIADITAVKSGSTIVTTTTEDGGYSASFNLRVIQPVKGVHIAPAVVSVINGQSQTLKAVITPEDADNQNVVWNVQNSAIASIDQNGILAALHKGKTSVGVTTEDGGYTATAPVTVFTEPHAPEGFSPNGDGRNDAFVCAMDENETYMLNIFDRSGQQYYTSADYKNDWEGIANTGSNSGKKVPAGTYYYVLTGNSSNSTIKGFVVIRY